MTSLRLALTELKRFSHGVLPKLVMLAVTLIPLLYGGVYLYSNWNPYGRVDNISAALVQSDKGATDESGKHVNTGEDVAKELKDAGNFDWQDVDTRQEAVDKVETGELGFALVIPSDFSQNLLSTSRFKPDENGKTGEVDPQKAGLEIITNDANNYLLTNIVERAGTSVRDSVASQVGDETANQLLASFTDIHGQLTQARDGSQKVTDGTVQLGSAIDRLKGGTSDLVSGSQRLNSGAHQLHDAENQLVDGQRQGLDGAQQLDDGAQQLDSATGQLADGTGQLRSGAGQLKGGTQQLADGSSQLKDGTATLAQGATQLKDGTAQLSSGASQLKDGTAQLSSGASQLKDGTGRLVSGADQLEQGIGQLDTQLKESGISQVGTNLTGVCRDLSSFNDQKATGRLGTDVSNAVVDENAKVVRETLEQKVKDGAIDLTPQQIDAIVSTLGGEEAHQRINAATAKGLNDFEATDIGKDLASLRSSTCAANGTSQIAQQIGQLTDGVAQLKDGSTTLAQGVKSADSAAGQLADGAKTLDEKTGELADGAKTLDEKTGEAKDGISTLDEKTGELADGAKTLNDKTGQLVSGVNQVDDGAQQLNSATGELTDGTGQLVSGSRQLLDGQTQARDGAYTLASGTDDAVSGATQLDDGAGQLQSGSSDLEDGSKNLTDGLRQGANKVPNLDESQRSSLAKVMSEPVSNDHDSLATAANYGEGMGPFFMSLALWIGVLITGQFVRPSNERAQASNTSNFRIMLGSWIPFAVVSVAQAAILFTVVKYALGFEMAHPWLMLWFMLLVSVAFSAIGQGLIFLLGNPGKLLVLILLILQLVTGGGLMPYQTLPQSLLWMHDAFPMGHSITAIRRLAYGVDESSVWTIVWMMVGYTLIGIALGFLGAIRSRTWTLSKLHPEIEA
ncbi:YhgE/Pip domain-containing protein [Rothia kristinae]|uniref:ABC-2 type transporter transmembrane domain-containing protein n=1 Tax=Rothia kristinae TaxID=37923 RepID=A0A199NRR5_9MICC|nr:YhgE/Pip domain-containing protein [Rothia kristinae]OAX51386.1 hypothetical protein AN277_0209135 [Rothia kristinae]